jgi:TRAP-type C4-dicarboxylate transport system substrate-binding protein
MKKTNAAAIGLIGLSVFNAEASTVLRFADYGPNRGVRAEAMEWMASELEKRSDGEIKVDFYWGGSLVGGSDTLKAIESGIADIGTVVGFFTPQQLQAYNIGDLPVENSDMWVGMRAMYDLSNNNEVLQEEFSTSGVKYLTNYTTGPVQLICRSEINSLKDLEGLKIRASGPYADTLEVLGAEVVNMSQADVYQALDSGLLDCNQNYYYAIEAYQQYEVAPYIIEMNWGQNLSFGIFVNNISYDSLNESDKKVINEVSEDFIDYLYASMKSSEESAKSKIIQEGSTYISYLSEEDRDLLNETSQLAIDSWSERLGNNGINADQVLAEYYELIEQYRIEKSKVE